MRIICNLLVSHITLCREQALMRKPLQAVTSTQSFKPKTF